MEAKLEIRIRGIFPSWMPSERNSSSLSTFQVCFTLLFNLKVISMIYVLHILQSIMFNHFSPFNLKIQQLLSGIKFQVETFFTFDLEVHEVETEGRKRAYILDSGRVLPSEFSQRNTTYLYRLHRAEFVSNYYLRTNRRLCCDVFRYL